jgi:hypothetical protein
LPHDQLELPYRCFENTASDLIDCAAHINDEITTEQELVARLRLINSCKSVIVAVGFTVSMNRKPPQGRSRGLGPFSAARWPRRVRMPDEKLPAAQTRWSKEVGRLLCRSHPRLV